MLLPHKLCASHATCPRDVLRKHSLFADPACSAQVNNLHVHTHAEAKQQLGISLVHALSGRNSPRPAAAHTHFAQSLYGYLLASSHDVKGMKYASLQRGNSGVCDCQFPKHIVKPKVLDVKQK